MTSRTISQPRHFGALIRRAIPVAVVGLVALTIAAGLANHFRRGFLLGTPLPPFLMNWTPDVQWPAAVALGVGIGCACAAPWAIARVPSGAAFAALGYVVTLAVGLSVQASRMGTAGWSNVFDLGSHGAFEAKFEYLPALPALHRGVAYYVGHFAQLLPYLPTHTKGNPPGPLVAMHLLGLTTPGRLAAAWMIVGSPGPPLTYGLGRSLGASAGAAGRLVDPERRGRAAAAFAAFSPCVLVSGFTSFDFVFATMAAAVAWLLVSRRESVVVLGCLAAGLAV